MPRYYFQVFGGESLAEDVERYEFTDDQCARRAAIIVARALINPANMLLPQPRVIVRSENQLRIASVTREDPVG